MYGDNKCVFYSKNAAKYIKTRLPNITIPLIKCLLVALLPDPQ